MPLRAGATAVRYGFVPVILCAAISSIVFRAEGQQWLTSQNVRVDYASCVLLSLIFFIWLSERIWPAQPASNGHLFSPEPGGLRRDLVFLFFITQFSALLIALVSNWLKPALAAFGLGFDTPRLWPVAAPFLFKVALAFFVVEFFSYWLHRAAHRVPLLWQFHSTHHVITQLNGLKALRTHPVDNVLFYVVRTVPLMLVGAGVDEVLTATTFGAVLGVLSHANVSVSERGLGLLVNLPGYHAVHHSPDLAQSNSNFGCHTIVWDRVFGTFKPSSPVPLAVGVHPVGTRSIWRELMWPFYRKVS